MVNSGKNDLIFFFKIFIILNFTGYKSQTLKKEVKPYFGDEEEIPHGCEFVQLPHPSGQGMNVGNPMSKSFLDMLQTGVLTSYSSTGLDDQNDTAKWVWVIHNDTGEYLGEYLGEYIDEYLWGKCGKWTKWHCKVSFGNS